MENQALEKEIFRLENQFWAAMRDNDIDTMMALSDDTCILTGPQGVNRVQKTDFGKIAESAPFKLKTFKLSDQQVSILNDNTVVIGYKVDESLLVGGVPVNVKAADSSTWVRRDDRWVCGMHTEAILGDPFGRDR